MNITTKETDILLSLASGDDRRNLILLGYIKTLFKQNELEEEWMSSKELSAITDVKSEVQCLPQLVGNLFGKLEIKYKTLNGNKKWSMGHLREVVDSASLVNCYKEDFINKIGLDKAEFFGQSNKGKSIATGYVNSYPFIPYPNVIHFNNHHDIYWKRWYKCTYSTIITVLNEELPKHSKFNENSGCIEWTGEVNPKGYALLSQSKSEGLPTRYVHRLMAYLQLPTQNLGMLKDNNEIEYEAHHSCENACCITSHHIQPTRKDLHGELHASSPVAHYHVKEKAPEEPAVLSNSVESFTSNGAVEIPIPIAPTKTELDKITQGFHWTPNYDMETFHHDAMLTAKSIPYAKDRGVCPTFRAVGGELLCNERDIEVTYQRHLEGGNLYVELNGYPYVANADFTRIYQEGVTQ